MYTETKYIEQLELFPQKQTTVADILNGNGLDDFFVLEEKILPKIYFLNGLRIEKRRAERSKTPLSIVLFSFPENGNGSKEGPKAYTRHFLNYLDQITRETDIKGYLDEGKIGLLLPDTDENGVKLCAEKIIQGNGHIPLSVITATYPDHIFQELLKEGENQPNLFSLYLDETMNPHWFQRALKKGIDIVGALTGIILFSPIMLIIALAVKISSPGPIIFKQTRLGLKGRRFPFYKYRSMYLNMDDRIHREYVSNLIEGQLEKINQGEKGNPFFKIKDDPRVTRVGKIIRKLSIDELPQFFNVLKGEMSLVGPRPPIPYEIEKYKPWHLRRILEVKPGITGLWQVSGRSKTTFDEMVRLDLRYVQNWSIWLDLKILIKTITEVLHPRGAA